MKTKLLILLSTLFLLVNLVWFFSPTVRTAPIPKDIAKQKPRSELLIGKWQMTTCNGDGIKHGPDIGVTVEFGTKGKVIWVTKDPKYGVREYKGSYTMIRDTIHYSRAKSDDADEREWDVRIETINETDLIVITKGNSPEAEKCVFNRIN